MPFKPETTFPERAPDVQIFFHGLLMLCPDSSGSLCNVGVHRLSIDHRLSVEVRVKGSEPPDPPLLRLGGTLDSMGLTIAVDPPTANGVGKFVPTAGPFDRSSNQNDPKDFRWSVDLQELDPLQPQMVLEESGISPGLTIKDGLFFTARLTDPTKLEVLLIDPSNPVLDLHRVARLVGANIYLEGSQRVILKWFGDGKVQRLFLPKTDGSQTALVYIDNSPSLMPIGQPTHSEFVEYFKVVTNATKKFDLDFNLLGPLPAGTDAIPCMPVVVGGGR